MFGSLFIISVTITYCSGYNTGYDTGYGYSSGGALGGAYGGLSLGNANNGLAGGVASGFTSLGNGQGIGFASPLAQSSPGPLPAAIQTRRTFEVVPVALQQEPVVPQVIEVEASEQPVQVIFRSASSPVLVQQFHTPGQPGRAQTTHSEDEPHRVVHEVLRPVIQEVREVIQPYRRVTQEVRPVLEEVHTVVAKGEGRHKGLAVGPVKGRPLDLDIDSQYYENAGGLGLSQAYKAKSKRA